MLKYLEEVYIIFIWLITKRVLDRVIFVFQILLLSQLYPQHRTDPSCRITCIFKTQPWTLKWIIHAATSVCLSVKERTMMTFKCY